jgi:hypothetical protein
MIIRDTQGKQQLDDASFAFDPKAYPETEVIELIE